MIAPLAVAPQPKGTFKMKNNHLILLAVVAAAGLQPQAKAQTIILGDAASFAVLAGSGITFTAGATTITGDIGTHPTATIAGPGTFSFVTGANHADDAITQAAKTALTAAYTDAAGRSATSVVVELGGTTKTPGVYTSGTFGITGTLTLDAGGDPNAVFIFKTGTAGTTLITAVGSQVLLTNGARAENTFWQVGSSATLNGTNFSGSILAHDSITLAAGATVDGRLLALDAHVTLGGNDTIAVPAAIPEPAATSMLFAGFVGLIIGVRRIRRHYSDRKLDLRA